MFILGSLPWRVVEIVKVRVARIEVRARVLVLRELLKMVERVIGRGSIVVYTGAERRGDVMYGESTLGMTSTD